MRFVVATAYLVWDFFWRLAVAIIKKLYEYQSELLLDTTGRSKLNFKINLEDETQCVIRALPDNKIKVFWKSPIAQDVAYGCMVILSEFMEDNCLDMIGSYDCRGKARYIDNPDSLRGFSKVPLYVMYDFVFIKFPDSDRKTLVSVETRDEMIESGIEFHGVGTEFLPYKTRSDQKTIIEGRTKEDGIEVFHIALENKDDFKNCFLQVNRSEVSLNLSFNRYDHENYEDKDDSGVILPSLINNFGGNLSIFVNDIRWKKGDEASIDYSNMKDFDVSFSGVF